MLSTISRFLAGGTVSHETLVEAEHSTFVLVDNPLAQYSEFVLRLVLAAIVATGGIIADSPATIIGAMLIAPLMSPMLGAALATTIGRPLAAIRALSIVIIGMGLALASSAVVMLLLPEGIDVTGNSVIASMTSPRVVDFVIALAAGCAAALASVREDIPEIVPGIAVSATIVPPLCIVGVCLTQGATTFALGAFLMFLTNLVSVLVMGTVVFMLMGLGRSGRSFLGARARHIWYVCVAAAVVALLVPLVGTSNSFGARAAQDATISSTASTWLEDSDYRLVSTNRTADSLTVTIAGRGGLPSINELGDELRSRGIDPGNLSMIVTPEYRATGWKATR